MAGLPLSNAAFRRPAASPAVEGMNTSTPGVWAAIPSMLDAWKGPRPGRYPPQVTIRITGACQPPSVRQYMLPSSAKI